MESSNAWERAQDAIARAEARSDDVVTPDNAVSPFDASMTTVIPQADVVRRGPPDPDSTQRLPHGRPPTPRRPGDAHGWPGRPPGRAGEHADRGARREPPPRPPELSDPAMPRVAPARPNTAPFPAADPGERRDDREETPPRRSPWWKRLFGR